MIKPPFQKTYLSRAQSRAFCMDNPVGDPFGGPAYGEKNEPVSAIAAVVAIAVGTAEVAAATAITFSAVMGGLMIAGGAASLVGNFTGNKKLMMIGGAVAGVAGLGLAGANLLAEAAAPVASETALNGAAQSAADTAAGQTMTQAGMSFDEQAAVFQQLGAGETATARETLNNFGLSADQQASIINNQPITGQTGVVNGSTPDSTYKEVFDKAGQDVSKSISENGLVNKDTTSALQTDVPIGSENSPQNLNDGVKVADAPKAQSVETPTANAPDAPVTPTTANQAMGGLTLDGKATTMDSITALQRSGTTVKDLGNGNFQTVGGNKGLLSNVGGWMKDNKEVISMGGKFIEGAAKYAFPEPGAEAAADYYNASAALRNAQANQINNELNRPKRVADAYKNIQYRPISDGLISGARG